MAATTVERTPVADFGNASTSERPSWHLWFAVGLAVLVAFGSVSFLAARQSMADDEFFTIGGANHSSLTGMWHGYRTSHDASPPADYLLSWTTTRVIGTSPMAWRVPAILGWVTATAALGLFLRKLHPAAVFVGATVPSASALVGLGWFARPYAPMLGALAVGLVAWQSSLERSHRFRTMAFMAVAFALAALLHYVAAGAVGLVVVAEVVALHRHPGRSRRVLALVVASLVPMTLSVVLVHGASALQHDSSSAFDPKRVLTFYGSTVLPAALLVLVVAAGLGAALLVKPRSSVMPEVGTVFSWEELTVAIGLVAVMPTVSVVGMWLTHGHYFHRYSAAALLGAGMLAAAATDVVVRRWTVFAWVAVGATLVSCWQANLSTQDATASNAAVHQALLDLEVAPGTGPVVFVATHEFALARADGRAITPGRLRYVDKPPELPGLSQYRVDLDAVVNASTKPVDVILLQGRLAKYTGGRGWRVQVIARSRIVTAERTAHLVHALVSRH